MEPRRFPTWTHSWAGQALNPSYRIVATPQSPQLAPTALHHPNQLLPPPALPSPQRVAHGRMHQSHKAAHVGAEAVGSRQGGVGLTKAHRMLCAVPAGGDEGVDCLGGAVAGIGGEPEPGGGAGTGSVQVDRALRLAGRMWGAVIVREGCSECEGGLQRAVRQRGTCTTPCTAAIAGRGRGAVAQLLGRTDGMSEHQDKTAGMSIKADQPSHLPG
jgi:hypothetical protein